MTPISNNKTMTLNELNTMMLVAQHFNNNNAVSNTLNLFNFNTTTTSSLDLTKMFGSLTAGLNFNFSNISFGTSSSTNYTATPGNCNASSGATGLDKKFLNKVKEIANRIGCDYKDLLGVMHSESSLNSKAVNKQGGATGLIQFMPATAKSLGTTTTALYNMSAYDQLDYVEKYLTRAKNSSALKNKSKLSAGDLYTLIFMPAKAGQETIATSGTKYYSWNSGLDANKDGKITNTELGNRVISHHVNESIFA